MSLYKQDGLEYVRRYYQVPAYVGVKVEYQGKPGKVTGGDGQYVKVRLECQKISLPYHPTDLTYLP